MAGARKKGFSRVSLDGETFNVGISISILNHFNLILEPMPIYISIYYLLIYFHFYE